MWDQLADACTFLWGEVELHVGGEAFEVVENLSRRGSQNVVNFVHLVKLVVARKEWEETEDFEEHAADSPNVHLVVVVAVRQQTLGRPVPPRRYVLLLFTTFPLP